MNYSRLAIILLISVPLNALFAQNAPKDFKGWIKQKEGAKIEPFLMLQLWGAQSVGQEVYNTSLKQYEPVDDRFNLQLRRARIGFRMQPYEQLRFTVITAYDQLGRDILTGTVGNSNNAAIPALGIWDAFMEWRLSKKSESLNLVAGYFRPQYSRECITGAWAVPSMEKSFSQNYIRRNLTGYGPGRTMGLNMGGIIMNSAKNLELIYNAGIFTPQYLTRNGNSIGTRFSPLYSGRLVLSIGDPEMDRYRINYDINYFGKRKGLSLAVNGAWQGETEVFEQNYALGGDMLFNQGPLNVDAEWNYLGRKGTRPVAGNQQRTFTAASKTGHFRGGYNIVLSGKYFLEPSFMWMYFEGAMDAESQADAAFVKESAGKEYTYDAGINWYLNEKRLKVMFHYTWRQADAGDAGDGSQVNMYFSEAGVGAIHRGNWLGLGVNAIF